MRIWRKPTPEEYAAAAIATAVLGALGVCLGVGAWAWWKILTCAGIL